MVDPFTMSYGALVDHLMNDETTRTVTTLPDGSVDSYYAISSSGDAIDDRQTLGEKIAAGETDSFQIERESREPGGQAVHMGAQAAALGEDVTTVGHLEDPAFDGLAFETYSIGSPSEIDVFPLEGGDIVFSRRSPDFEDWSLEPLRSNVPSFEDWLSADAICWGNWALVGGTTAAMAALADGSIAADAFVFDPGPVSVRSRGAVRELLETLGKLESTTDVLYSVNRTELEYTADAIDANTPDGASDVDRLAAVREAAGITGAVVHAQDVSAIATASGETTVPNLDVENPRRRTGAGDRFSGALAIGSARNWNWDVTLALANLCASYYVETATTGNRHELVASLEQTDIDETQSDNI